MIFMKYEIATKILINTYWGKEFITQLLEQMVCKGEMFK